MTKSVKKYNKLVRDRIPDIITNNNQIACFEILDDEKYLEKLQEKLLEEVFEYYESKSIEELVDLIEVIYAIAESMGVGIESLDEIRKDKKDKKGSFLKKILLISVE